MPAPAPPPAAVLVTWPAHAADGLPGVVGDLLAAGLDVAVAGTPRGLAAGAGPGALIVAPDAAAARAALARRGVAAGEVAECDGDVAGLRDRLARWRGRPPAAGRDPAWTVEVPDSAGGESVAFLGDGVLGSAGTGPEARVHASGVYTGQGPATRLLPLPLWNRLGGQDGPERRVLDLRSGAMELWRDTPAGPVRAYAFSSLARPGVVALRAEGSPGAVAGAGALTPVAGTATSSGRWPDGVQWVTAADHVGGAAAAACETEAEGPAGRLLERIGAYVADAGRLPDPAEALARLDGARAAGFDRLLAEQRAAWRERWGDCDVSVDGDDRLTAAVRFGLAAILGSVPERGEAAVGARGLSGPGYGGHVFWDADVFVLPFLAATRPAAARAMLDYRLNRLPAARDHARRSGRAGARLPWESARSGRDVTPTIDRRPDGSRVPIRTGLLEEHVTADVAWAAWWYLDWTGDDAVAPAVHELTRETARYWASRVRLDRHGRAHVYGVIGPDEYHEPVDDSAYTNVMARWNLRRAARVSPPGRERDRWLALADALVDGYDPQRGVHEEFAGFFRLDPLILADVAERPVDADRLLGRPRVRRSQVVKQADVLMLHHLVPGELRPGTLAADLAYYDPRTAHGSSLSPAIHAALLARLGRVDDAVALLGRCARFDIDDVNGTAVNGLHIATQGGVWQALVMGFAGVRPRGDALEVDPRVPPAWGALRVSLRFRGARVHLCLRPGEVEARAEPGVHLVLPGGRRVHAGPEGVTV